MIPMQPQPLDRAPLKTICGLCASGCGMCVSVRKGQIERITPDKQHPSGHGKLCRKGVHARDIVHSPKRLTQPLLKRRSGFESVSWDTALTFIADKISRIQSQWRGRALSLFKGHMPNPSVLDAFSNLMAALDSPHSTGAAQNKSDQMFPLIGTTRRPGIYIHSRYRNIPSFRKHEPHATVRLHPTTADQRGIGDRETVRVVSSQGSVCMQTILTPKTRPDVVVLDSGWGNPGDGVDNVNQLTSDDRRDPVSASTANRRFACEVEKILEEL